jgi:hypothetical protein
MNAKRARIRILLPSEWPQWSTGIAAAPSLVLRHHHTWDFREHLRARMPLLMVFHSFCDVPGAFAAKFGKTSMQPGVSARKSEAWRHQGPRRDATPRAFETVDERAII